MIVVPKDGGEEKVEIDQGYDAMSPELELCVAHIRDLRAELEFERHMRRKAEALAAELAEMRRQGEVAEAECQTLRDEVGAARDEADRALEGTEEERWMLRIVEVWREERVQIKLVDARAMVEEKLREMDDVVGELHATTAASDNNHNKSSSCSSSSPNDKTSPTMSQHGQQSLSRSQHGQENPSQSQQDQLHRREAGGGENPHIRRGVKGFVEFPKAVRVRSQEERVDLVSNLECQRAQLRVLMRYQTPAAGMGLIAASNI